LVLSDRTASTVAQGAWQPTKAVGAWQPGPPRIIQEELLVAGIDRDWQTIYQRTIGGARVYDDSGADSSALLVIPDLSGLSLMEDSPDRTHLSRFKQRLARLHVLQINPQAMASASEAEEGRPNRGLANYISWYRHLAQEDPSIAAMLFQHLKDVIDGFNGFRLTPEGARRLDVLIRSAAGHETYDFSELSDGQRALTALYTVAALLQTSKAYEASPSVTFCIDEPENYVALAELQPWIQVVEEALDGSNSQLLLVSHHPEFIDSYAHTDAVRVSRDGGGPARIAPFTGESAKPLLPSELVARGWEDE
jgi:hypothetical protein